jgi:hypothetical protein
MSVVVVVAVVVALPAQAQTDLPNGQAEDAQEDDDEAQWLGLYHFSIKISLS